jgi:hypothetical protein
VTTLGQPRWMLEKSPVVKTRGAVLRETPAAPPHAHSKPPAVGSVSLDGLNAAFDRLANGEAVRTLCTM